MLDHPAADRLLERLNALIADEGPLRARDAAARLGVSEAELLAAKARAGVAVRLRADPERGFGPLIEAMPAAGEVMVLTRNEACVHERHGAFGNVQIGEGMGFVANGGVDLRLFLRQWAHGFAVEEPAGERVLRSLQFFDPTGTAVHKIYATAGTDRDALERLIADWTDPDPQPLTVTPAAPPAPPRPDTEVDVAALRRDWLAMQDSHEFFGLLRRHQVGRVQALRLAGGDLTRRVAADAPARLLELASAGAVPIMVFVGNRGCVQIHTGPVKRIMPRGPWINVLDPEFNLHLRTDLATDCWLVRKPTASGTLTALEVYDADGEQAVLFLGTRERGEPERADWRALLAKLGGEDWA
jgi:putative hemin transport protein